MQSLKNALSKLLWGHGKKKKPAFQPLIERLEDRWAPSVSTLPTPAPAAGVISGQVSDSGQSVTGVTITLVGKTASGQSVDVSTQTDSGGDFKFQQVDAGTYTLTRGSEDIYLGGTATFGSLGGTVNGDSIGDISLQPGQVAANYNFSVSFLSAQAISLQDFLNTASENLFTSISPAGTGLAMADGSVQPNASNNYTNGTTTSASISGLVENSSNSDGIANVQVSLTGIDTTGNSVFETTTTNASGDFTFNLSRGGTYTLQVVGRVSGFRAGEAIIPTGADSAGGLSTLNSEIYNIVVADGSTTAFTGYDFQQIPLTAPTSATGPEISAQLADDTAGPNGTTSDNITADPSIQGSVASGTSKAPITSLFAGVNGAATVNITDQLNGGDFYLGEGLLAKIKGLTDSILPDGSYTVNLKAVDSAGNVGTFSIAFTLQTAGPATPTLTVDSSTLGSLGTIINATGGVILSNPSSLTSGTVSLDVTTSANDVVQLFAGSSITPIATETADSNGDVTFTGISLSAGVNNFIARAEDNAGNYATLSTFVVLNQAPTSSNSSAVNTTVSAGTTSSVLNLADGFTNPNGGNTIVLLQTSDGPIYLQMFDNETPQTVANFLAYINSGAYNEAVLDRLVPGFVLQGGEYTLNTGPTSLSTNTTLSTIDSEQSLASNTTNEDYAGTLSMALNSGSTSGSYNTNSATDQFFFNLSDNSTASSNNLDPNFTVFAKVLSGAGMRVLNTLGSESTVDESSYKSDLTNLPLKDYSGSSFPKDAAASNFELIDSATIVSQPDALTYKVTNVSDPSNVLTSDTPSVNANGTLTLDYKSGVSGIVTITVSATDLAGVSATQTFTVTVGTVNATTTSPTTAAAPFSTSSQMVTLTGSVTSSAGTVDGGTFTFSVPGIGSVTSGTVANGTASAQITIPAGTTPQSFTVDTSYSGAGTFESSSNSAGTLTINAASTTTQPTTATGSANDASAQTITLTGTVTSTGGTVNGGTINFTVGQLGTVTSGTVTNGTAQASFILPANTPLESLTITTAYSGASDFAASSDDTGALTVS